MSKIDEILAKIMNETDVGTIHALAMTAYEAAKVGRGDDLTLALQSLIREAQAVADDHHKPRYARLDEALESAKLVLSRNQESNTQKPEQGDDGESSGQMLQRLGIDGMLWSIEMHKRFPQVAQDNLLGWCCNMIMAGYYRGQAAQAESAKEIAVLKLKIEELEHEKII